MGAAAVALLGQISERVDVAKILSPLDIDDHGRIEGRRIGVIPEKEFLTVAFEGYFDEVRHTLLRPCAETQEFLTAPPHQFFRAHFAQLFEILAQHSLQ